MPKQQYITMRFRPETLATIERANAIIAEYAAQGFDLTLRQLYYQFVSRGLIANSDREYKKLGEVLNNGRLAGLVDWSAITDRTRNLRGLTHWQSPREIVSAVASQYRIDKWATQPYRVQVWIEKDALVGVVAGVCNLLDVPYFSCRGYTSQSEMWAQAQTLLTYTRQRRKQTPVILHLGDHDPSGIDMTRDIRDRMAMFMGGLTLERLALNMDQVEEYQPPPNPTKLSDSRAVGYIAELEAAGFAGDTSWELDALDPRTISDLITRAVTTLRDPAAWNAALRQEEEEREGLVAIHEHYAEVREFVEGL